MKIKSQRDFWSGLMFLVIGIAFAWGATAYSFGNSARPGPGYFPFGLGVLLALLGAIVVFERAHHRNRRRRPRRAHRRGSRCIVILGTVALFGCAAAAPGPGHRGSRC